MRALVVAPHPDDEVLGCGGTIARHVDEGDEVEILVVSEGVSAQYPGEPARREARRREAERAAAILGARIAFADLPDMRLDRLGTLALNRPIDAAFRRLRPEVVYLPSPWDLSADHVAVAEATLVVARPLPGSPAARLYAYEVPSSTEWAARPFAPTSFCEISGEPLRRKLEAFQAYEGEARPWPHPRSEEAIVALARLRGSTAGVEAAEAFALLREVRRTRREGIR